MYELILFLGGVAVGATFRPQALKLWAKIKKQAEDL